MFKRALFGRARQHDLVLFSLRCSTSRHPWKTHRQPPEAKRSERYAKPRHGQRALNGPAEILGPDAVLNSQQRLEECGNAFLGERVPAQPRLRLLMCVTSCPRLSETQDHITHFGRSGRTKARQKRSPPRADEGPCTADDST